MILEIEQMKAKDLKPGDIFSGSGVEYWGNLDPNAVGHKVFIRSSAPIPNAVEGEKTVYRITIRPAIEVARSIPKSDG